MFLYDIKFILYLKENGKLLSLNVDILKNSKK